MGMKKVDFWKMHRGFAYSSAPGNDKLVTGKLTDRIGKALAQKIFQT